MNAMERLLTVSTAASTRLLTTLDAARTELGVTDNASNAAITRLIGQASAAIAAHTRRVFPRETVVETFRLAEAAWHLPLARVPAVSITSVVEDGTTLSVSDYECDGEAGLLYRLISDQRCPWDAMKIVVTYPGGYILPGASGATLPADIERACLLAVVAGWRAAGRDPMLRSETVDGVGSVSWLDPRSEYGGLPQPAAALLAPWVRPAL